MHLHHAPYLWGEVGLRRYPFWDFRYLLKKPVVLTAHDTRSLEELLQPDTGSLWKKLVKRRLLASAEFRDSVESAPFITALTITASAWERNRLLARGAKAGFVFIVPPAVPIPASATCLPVAQPALCASVTVASLPSDRNKSPGPRLAEIRLARPTPENPYAVEQALAQGGVVLAPDTQTTREITARVPCLERFTDEADAQARMERLRSDPARCAELAAAARRYAERFAPPRVAKSTLRVYAAAVTAFGTGPHHQS